MARRGYWWPIEAPPRFTGALQAAPTCPHPRQTLEVERAACWASLPEPGPEKEVDSPLHPSNLSLNPTQKEVSDKRQIAATGEYVHQNEQCSSFRTVRPSLLKPGWQTFAWLSTRFAACTDDIGTRRVPRVAVPLGERGEVGRTNWISSRPRSPRASFRYSSSPANATEENTYMEWRRRQYKPRVTRPGCLEYAFSNCMRARVNTLSTTRMSKRPRMRIKVHGPSLRVAMQAATMTKGKAVIDFDIVDPTAGSLYGLVGTRAKWTAGADRRTERELGLPKLNFQVLLRTIATLAQTKGSVKDVQGILGHSKVDTTVNIYMQPIAARVMRTQEAIFAELTARPKLVAVS